MNQKLIALLQLTEFVIHASMYEIESLHIDYKLNWNPESRSINTIEVGKIAGSPVVITIIHELVNSKYCLFWHSCSDISSISMIETWLSEHCTEVIVRTTSSNFYNVSRHLK